MIHRANAISDFPASLSTGILRSARDVGLENAIADFRMRSMAPLPEDAQELFDDVAVRVGRDRLSVVGSFIDAGLTFNLPNWLGVLELDWDKVSEAGFAKRGMTPGARGENQLPDRERATIPIWATWIDFEIGIRTQLASERAGTPLDTYQLEQSVRRINEAVEDAAINGVSAAVGGNSVPGLLNAPNVNTVTYETNTAWDDSGKTGAEILADVQSMKTALHADRMFGPYALYIPTEYDIKLDEDFKAESEITIRERLLRIDGLNQIVVADQLPDDRTIMVQLTSDVVDVVIGQQPTPLTLEGGNQFNIHQMVLACIVPRVRDTYSDQSGICTGNV